MGRLGLRFGAFELDTSAGELRQRGDLVKLAAQPLKVLEILVRRAGEVVTRQEIRDHVWSGGTVVDFEQGLNFCIRQVREALDQRGGALRRRRGAEAVAGLRELEPKVPTRVRDFMIAARTPIEGKETESHAAIGRIIASGFYDPEAFLYLARHLARLCEPDEALAVLTRAVDGGFACLSTLQRDPWLEPLRERSAFTTLLRRVEASCRSAESAFESLSGSRFVGLAAAF